MEHSCHHAEQHGVKKRIDFFFWGTFLILLFAYGVAFFPVDFAYVATFSKNVFELVNRIAWGVLLGMVFVGILSKVPRQFVTSLLGKGGTFSGILRATGAGVLLDLCSHGILLVGMKLYERGASLGQTMAFLIASPWNSLSLTLVLWALIGFRWMIAFLLLSMVIAVISGLIFDGLVKRKVLPENPNQHVIPDDFRFWPEFKKLFHTAMFSWAAVRDVARHAIVDSRMILRWIFLGVIFASLLRTFLSAEHFQTFFGPTIAGLGLTLVMATVLEVCSEGSTPVAADLLTRAAAPGNAFAFLMTGVSTDYTEILSLRETTKSWKIAFFLPLVTLPQVILLALLLN